MCLSKGDGWQQPSLLLRHDSVDSGVAKGGHGGLAGSSCWKETPSWHGSSRGAPDGHHHHQGRHPKRVGGDRDRQVGHRQRNGNYHPRKGASYQDKFPNEERKDGKDDKLKFVEEDFVSRKPLPHPMTLCCWPWPSSLMTKYIVIVCQLTRVTILIMASEVLNKVSLKNKLVGYSVDFKGPTAISFISHSSITWATFQKVLLFPSKHMKHQFLQEALTKGLIQGGLLSWKRINSPGSKICK